jgi:hypothetical protein
VIYASPFVRLPEMASPFRTAVRTELFSTSVRNCEYGISGVGAERLPKVGEHGQEHEQDHAPEEDVLREIFQS